MVPNRISAKCSNLLLRFAILIVLYIMNKVHWVVVFLALIIDNIGTTISQLFFSNFTDNFYFPIFAGGIFSIIAGYFLVSRLRGEMGINLLFLCFLNILIGFSVLEYKGAATPFNLVLMLVTPVLNILGAYISFTFVKKNVII